MSSKGDDFDKCPPKKERKDRKKRRKFQGNRFTGSLKKATETQDLLQTASSKKLGEAASTSSVTKCDEMSGYRFMDVGVLINFVRDLPCKKCHNTAYTVCEKRRGVCSTLTFTCDVCDNVSVLKSSNEDVNLRFAAATFSIGCHHQKGRRFLHNMNMPPSVSAASFSIHRDKIAAATEAVAKDSMTVAAQELSSELPSDEATVSCDGTWQRRGFVSKNGIATVLSVHQDLPAKVLDIHVASNHCDACVKAKKKMGEGEFEDWYEIHKSSCMKNHEGTSGKMESTGMLTIFRRSEQQYGLKYTGYLGDGDSKSFHTVHTADPTIYRGKEIRKLECCGHVQKRMGKRLMDKVKECKSKKFEEHGKKYTGIGGRAGLTMKQIKRIQGHYGGAIRANVGDVEKMRTAVWAVWKHRGKNHSDCGNWCPAKQGNDAKANAKALPRFVLDIIKPVFTDLTSEKLLEACLHGGTQNANESFHGLIWARCPKTAFVGRRRLELAAYDAVIVFNEGELGRLPVFRLLGLECGGYMETGFRILDVTRVKSSIKQSTPIAKAGRKRKRQSQGAWEGDEGEYQPGGH